MIHITFLQEYMEKIMREAKEKQGKEEEPGAGDDADDLGTEEL
jgi:hypothetical protein